MCICVRNGCVSFPTSAGNILALVVNILYLILDEEDSLKKGTNKIFNETKVNAFFNLNYLLSSKWFSFVCLGIVQFWGINSWNLNESLTIMAAQQVLNIFWLHNFPKKNSLAASFLLALKQRFKANCYKPLMAFYMPAGINKCYNLKYNKLNILLPLYACNVLIKIFVDIVII